MRAVLVAFALFATPALADRTISTEISATGLAATEARLAALPAPKPDELFALAGIRFLSGVEGALQLRWQTGMRADWSELPILRLPIPENPAARPFAPADVVELFDRVDRRMTDARAALDTLGDQDFALEIRLSDLWFDINANGARDEGEQMAAIAGLTLAGLGRFVSQDQPFDPVVRFDAADAAWLAAYTQFLSAFATAALAFDPAPAVQRVINAAEGMKALWGTTPPPNAMDMMFGRQVDRVAMVLLALQTTPDPALSQKVHGHLVAMIADNRRFWKLVEAETDNALEWVPNDRQTSALGLPMPPGTGARWQAVLADAEAVLQGRLLMPYWRLGGEAGLNLKKMFENPPAIDLITFVQGEGLLPYAEKGPRVTADSWNDFQTFVQGDAMLFAVFLN